METQIMDEQIFTPRKIRQKRKGKILMLGVIGLGVIVIVFAILIGVYANKASTLREQNKGYKQRLEMIEEKMNQQNMNKRLNFTNLKLRDIKIDVEKEIEDDGIFAQVLELNLTQNLIQIFVENKIPSLKYLYLDKNPIYMFANNYLPNIQKLDLSKNSILISFIGNNLENVQELLFFQPLTLMNFSGNTLNKISQLNWVTGQNSLVLNFDNNTMNLITNLDFQCPNIVSFHNNNFPKLKNFTTHLKQNSMIFPQKFPLKFSENNLPSLQYLSFQHQQLIFQFNNLINLKKLKITNCSISNFKNNIFNKELQLSISNGLDNFYFQDNTLGQLDLRNNYYNFIQIKSPVLTTLHIDRQTQTTIRFVYNSMNKLSNFTKNNILFDQFSCNQLNNLNYLDLYNRSIKQFLNNSLLILSSLDLSQNPIQTFDNSIIFPNYIQSLNLTNTLVKIFKNNYLPQLKQLKFQKYSSSISKVQVFSSNTFFLYDSKLSFTDSLTEFNYNSLAAVTSIEISSAGLKEFNSNILPSIQELIICLSSLQNLTNFQNYQTLVELTITFSSITVFSFYNFPKMEKLNLNHNELNDFKMNNLPILRELILSENKLMNVTGLVLGKLQKLDVTSQSNLKEFNDNNLPLLTSFEIQIGNKNITSFSNNTLPLLTQLRLTMSQISSFTNNNLTLVQTLFLGNNKLTSILNNTFPNIKTLSLGGNLFNSSIGEQIKLLNLSQLQQVALFDNEYITQNDWQKIKNDIYQVAPNAVVTF